MLDRGLTEEMRRSDAEMFPARRMNAGRRVDECSIAVHDSTHRMGCRLDRSHVRYLSMYLVVGTSSK